MALNFLWAKNIFDGRNAGVPLTVPSEDVPSPVR